MKSGFYWVWVGGRWEVAHYGKNSRGQGYWELVGVDVAVNDTPESLSFNWGDDFRVGPIITPPPTPGERPPQADLGGREPTGNSDAQ